MRHAHDEAQDRRSLATRTSWRTVAAGMCRGFVLLALSASSLANEDASEAPAQRTLSVETYRCNCTDRPVPHYPYTLMIVKSSQGEVVVRPEGQESAVKLTPLALRYGDRYCALEAEESCYGNFAHPCEFTDFRYGPTLAQFFPSCKVID